MDGSGGSSGGNELGRFLRARRERVQPGDVGLSGAGRRRVPGLRRDELAMLAGISTEYYVRLEQGRDQNPSTQVLEALAGALGLNSAETAHLFRLSRPLPVTEAASAPGPGCEQTASPVVEQLIASWSTTPAVVIDRLLTVLAVNTLAASLSVAHRPGTNLLRAHFLDPLVEAAFQNWDEQAEALVAAVRTVAGAGGANDPVLIRLVGDLSANSERFRALWERHEIRAHTSGVSVFEHPWAGRLELRYEKLAVLSSPGPCAQSSGQYLLVYQAEPGSVSAHRLASLADACSGADTHADVLVR